ncbi:hypothetical protein TSOC_011936, partial [Tetrabaena socialis]
MLGQPSATVTAGVGRRSAALPPCPPRTGTPAGPSPHTCGSGAPATSGASCGPAARALGERARPGVVAPAPRGTVCRATRLPTRGRPPLRLQTRPTQDGQVAGEEPGEVAEVPLPGVVRVTCVQDVPRFDLPLLLGNFRSSTCNAVAVAHAGERYLLAPSASVAYGSQ